MACTKNTEVRPRTQHYTPPSYLMRIRASRWPSAGCANRPPSRPLHATIVSCFKVRAPRDQSM
jgi:hypothetical protein